MSIHNASRNLGPLRARAIAALFIVGGCSGDGDDELRKHPAREAKPAAQIFDDDSTDVADATASVASAQTKALFAPGECDEVYEFRFFGADGPGKPYMVQPGSEDQPTVQFDAPWGEEEVQAVAFKPLIDNKKVMHHYILMGGETGWLDTWAPGNDDPALPVGVGMELPRGPGAISLNMHYYNLAGTKAEPDRSGTAVCVVRGAHLRPKTAAVHMGFGGVAFPMVPPNVKSHDVSGSCVADVKEPVTLYSLFPHMHTRGRHMKLTVSKPDGRVLTLHDASFSFDEQAAYPLASGYLVEKGDTFTTTCTYDNTSNTSIDFGVSTESEMCMVITGYYPRGALECGVLGGFDGTQPPDGFPDGLDSPSDLVPGSF